MNRIKRYYRIFFLVIIGLFLVCFKCGLEKKDGTSLKEEQSNQLQEEIQIDVSGTNTYHMEVSNNILDVIPEFSGDPYIVLNENCPDFTSEEKEIEDVFENYSELDELGRCGIAYANICNEIMPTEERGEIGQIKPSGWQLVKYDIIDGRFLYNRCHLIGYQLAGENANEKNLITGTRYMNISGMLPFENMVVDYVKATDHHVLYRVTPVYDGSNLVAAGVEMEAYSIEDDGRGICFHVFVYNCQPGIGIDYATGGSWLLKEDIPFYKEEGNLSDEADAQTYVLNTNTKKFHLPACESVNDMKDKNKKEVFCNKDELIEDGYQPCQRCNP